MKSFLSYPSEQRSVARALYDFLCSIGIQPWFDQESLIGGQDWDRERKIAQRAVDLTFLVLSPETISRPGVIQREVKEILDLLETRPLGHTFLVSLRTRDISVLTGGNLQSIAHPGDHPLRSIRTSGGKHCQCGSNTGWQQSSRRTSLANRRFAGCMSSRRAGVGTGRRRTACDARTA